MFENTRKSHKLCLRNAVFGSKQTRKWVERYDDKNMEYRFRFVLADTRRPYEFTHCNFWSQANWQVDRAIKPSKYGILSHTNSVVALQFLGRSKLASGSWDKTIKIWDIVSKSCLRTLHGHTDYVDALQHLGQNVLASGSDV